MLIKLKESKDRQNIALIRKLYIFKHHIIGLQTVIPLLIQGVMVKTVVFTLQLLKLWPSVGYGVSALDKVVPNHTICCALPQLTSCSGSHPWHVCKFSQIGLNLSTLPHPPLNISTECIHSPSFNPVWFGGAYLPSPWGNSGIALNSA